MLNHLLKGQWAFAISALGFVPPYCDSWPEWGGGSGSGGSPAAAGEAAAGAAAGEAAGGAGGAASVPDRVVEPLLGCAEPEESASEPGAFEVLPLPRDVPFTNAQWIRDWSGDGRTAVGWYPTPASGETPAATTLLRWTTGAGFSILEKRDVDHLTLLQTPTALASCDASVLALRHGDGTFEVRGGMGFVPEEGPHYFNYPTLSEDGSSVVYSTAIPAFPRPWTMWRGPGGAAASILIDPVRSLSSDGTIAFGRGCFPTCPGERVFRWEPGLSKVDVDAPTPIVAADGVSVVYDHTLTKLGIWRAEGTEVIDCGKRCHVLAWSSQAQVLLLTLEGEYTLWTAVHGFRPLVSLLAVPAGWRVLPTFLSLDGRTVTGTATNDEADFPYFRATLVADAFQ
jgi:hypothetical protein